jgi:hypothetical protein
VPGSNHDDNLFNDNRSTGPPGLVWGGTHLQGMPAEAKVSSS